MKWKITEIKNAAINISFRVEKLGLDNFNFISYQLLHSLRKKVDNVIKK